MGKVDDKSQARRVILVQTGFLNQNSTGLLQWKQPSSVMECRHSYNCLQRGTAYPKERASELCLSLILS